MLRNILPADELGEIRSEITMLKARADILRKAIVDDPNIRSGARFHVDVRNQKRRVFLRGKLPAQILADPSMWENRISSVVTVKEMPQEEDDFLVFERF